MILADTGPLVAAMDRRDPAHFRVADFLRHNTEPVIVPTLVIAEVGYFAMKRLGASAEAAFVRQVAKRAIQIEDGMLVDYERAASLIETYADYPLGVVDALVIAIAERLDVTKILTLDVRHFSAVSPLHCAAFELLPA